MTHVNGQPPGRPCVCTACVEDRRRDRHRGLPIIAGLLGVMAASLGMPPGPDTRSDKGTETYSPNKKAGNRQDPRAKKRRRGF